MTTTLPSAADVATLPAERLNELAARAMYGEPCGERLWRRPETNSYVSTDATISSSYYDSPVVCVYYIPSDDANQAVELAERVFAHEDDGWNASFSPWLADERRYEVEPASFGGPTSGSTQFSECLTRASVAAWIARQG